MEGSGGTCDKVLTVITADDGQPGASFAWILPQPVLSFGESKIENYFPLIPAWSIAACIAFHDSASGLFTSTATIFALGK